MVPGEFRVGHMLRGEKCGVVIPWQRICKIGENVILVEREPEIRGVIVVAEGAADPAVRLSLQRAVQAVTGVPLSCIEVFEMNYLS